MAMFSTILTLLILTPLLGFAEALPAIDFSTLKPVVRGKYCEGLIADPFSQYEQHWIDYGDAKLTVKTSLNGSRLVVLMRDNIQYQIDEQHLKSILSEEFFKKTAPEGSEFVKVNYPEKGEGWAYRVPIEGDLYLKNLEPNDSGVIQIPGYPPFFERVIDGKKYLDIPHPDVFNEYIGHTFLFSYTANVSMRFPGEIPPFTYARIWSHGFQPISPINVDSGSMTHDIIGHGLVMIAVRSSPIWSRTVDLAKRALYIKDHLIEKNFESVLVQNFIEAGYRTALYKLTIWEKVANRWSGPVARARSPKDVADIVKKVEEQVTPILNETEADLEKVESQFKATPNTS